MLTNFTATGYHGTAEDHDAVAAMGWGRLAVKRKMSTQLRSCFNKSYSTVLAGTVKLTTRFLDSDYRGNNPISRINICMSSQTNRLALSFRSK